MTAHITHVERFTLPVLFVERVRRDMERAGRINIRAEVDLLPERQPPG